MRPLHLKLLCLALVSIAILALDASAQSGRKKTEPPAPVPVVTPTPSVTIEPVSAKITSLVVGGEVTAKSLYFNSNYLDLISKEFISWMKHEPRPFLSVTKGGKMKFEAAREAAKNETGRHLLWLEVLLKDDGYGGLYVAYVDYAILLPQTGKALFKGQLIPGEEKIVAQGGVMNIPTMQKRSIIDLQMKQVARELALRLKATSWFD